MLTFCCGTVQENGFNEFVLRFSDFGTVKVSKIEIFLNFTSQHVGCTLLCFFFFFQLY